ncbi:MAG: PAS domain S-box protein [Oxalobacteraceae bacterium]|nr:PAS domain S-box protein [Oxalobacteraceae bacterium]
MTADGQEINGSTGTDHLRLGAEQELQNKRSNSATLLSDIDVRKRLHELQVTQIELALQNSELLELQHARQEIELLLARYTDLYEFAPIGYFTLGRDGTLHEVNLTGTSLIGLARSKLVGRRFGAFVSLESRPTFNAFLARVFADENKQSCEVLLLNGEQRPFYAHIEANADAAEHTCRLVVEDISARKAAEKSLQNAHDELETKVQERTAALMLANAQLKAEIAEHKRTEAALRHTQYILNQAQRVAHVGCWERNNVSGAPQWSDEFFRICGLPPQAFTPNLAKLLQVIHPEDRNAVYRMVRRAIDHNHNFNSISRIIRPDGTIRHVRFQGNILRSENRKLQTLVGSVLDITEFKNAEEALLQSQETIRRLAAHQEWVKENERKRIAREIHDELGQNLLALRIDVSMLAARTEHCHPRLNAKVKAALNDIDVTIRSVRGIINNLRPAVLDLGLPAAFEWQVKEFQRRNGIACNLNISGGDADYQLEDDLATALFRILQESLTNISRHARADRITISLSKDACDNVVMKVADNGIGLPQDSRRKANSYGLIGIRERVNTLRGELIIDSHQNQGTALTVIIPTECPPPGNVG